MKKSFDNPINRYSLLFMVSIGLLFFGSLAITIDSIGAYYINFKSLNDWNTVLRELINKLPFYLPIVWLAFFASRRLSEYQRLQQEYAHKEALAKSYHSY